MCVETDKSQVIGVTPFRKSRQTSVSVLEGECTARRCVCVGEGHAWLAWGSGQSAWGDETFPAGIFIMGQFLTAVVLRPVHPALN